MSYITVLVKDLKCMAKTWSAMLHAIFKYSSARREDYQQLHAKLGHDIETFGQHTKVRWLSIGPVIRRVLEQWDTICQFIKVLEKDNTRKPKSINFKRAAALLATGERNVTRVGVSKKHCSHL